MKNSLKLFAAAIVIASLGMTPVSAKNGNGNGQGNGNSQKDKGHDKSGQQDLVYAGIDQKQAKKYAKQYTFYGYKPLPPGIRKNLARGKPIPPGLAYNRLPPDYIAHLPRIRGMSGADTAPTWCWCRSSVMSSPMSSWMPCTDGRNEVLDAMKAALRRRFFLTECRKPCLLISDWL